MSLQKFRFCGDGDCPDWVLGEIISTLSVLEANKLKALADLVAKKILGQDFDVSLRNKIIELKALNYFKFIGNGSKILNIRCFC